MAGTAEQEALGILADTVQVKLGRANIVAREVRRAYETGKSVDLFTAKAAFNALPGWQRREIDGAARERAHLVIQQRRSTARDWAGLAGARGRGDVVFPRFSKKQKEIR